MLVWGKAWLSSWNFVFFGGYGIALYLAFKKNRQAIFYTIAWSTFLFFIALGAITTFGIIDLGGAAPIVSNFGSQFGSASEAILLSFGLADRITTLKRKELEQSKKIIDNLEKIQVLKDRLESALLATKEMSEKMKKEAFLEVASTHILKQLKHFSIKQIVFHETQKDDDYKSQVLHSESKISKPLETPIKGSIQKLEADPNRILVPIAWKDNDFGIYSIHHQAELDQYSEEDIWFVETMAQSLALTLQNIYYQEHLKDLVDERTAELQTALESVTERQRKVDDILQNIEQGIMTFDSNFNIGEEFSKHLLSIFQVTKDQMQSLTIDKLLFDKVTMSQDKQHSAMESLKSRVDIEDYSWEAQHPPPPRELVAKYGDQKKYIELEWKPLTKDDDLVNQIMVVAKDVTTQTALKEQLKEESQKKKAQVFLQSSFRQTNKCWTASLLKSKNTSIKSKKSLLEISTKS